MKIPFWHPKYRPDLFGVIIFALALSQALALISFRATSPDHNILGIFGHFCGIAWLSLFGPTAALGVISLFALSFTLLNGSTAHCSQRYVLSSIGLLFSISMIFCLIQVLFPHIDILWKQLLAPNRQNLWLFPVGGIPMHLLYFHTPYFAFHSLFNVTGTALVTATIFTICSCILFDIEVQALWKKTPREEKKRAPKERPASSNTVDEEPEIESFVQEDALPKEASFHGLEPTVIAIPQKIQPLSNSSYQLPPIDLLKNPKKTDLSELKQELKDKADRLEKTLLNFGIEAKVGQVHCGPTITMFEVHPAIGVKVGKIKTIENDIALNMEAKSLRIIAPIPGKAAIGIEVPNQVAQEVSFKELLMIYQQRGAPFKIPMLLGKAVNGELVLTDLTKMPHCIIAGATGSGKSVCINTIIMSILMLARPDECRFLMIDPKKVELSGYTNLPHMLSPVITDASIATASLSWLVREMEKRYEILRLTGQRNIDSFNKRTRNIEAESSTHVAIPEKLPYIVGIIDELADLMMVASQDIEGPIARIAQMARAIGIHLIVATQRPSREVITGLIKANFPARIACKVASRVNSQIILDDIGAESLLGNGDMLILLPGSSQPIRAQGAFIRDEEINDVISFISNQLPPNYAIGSPEKLLNDISDDEETDDLFDSAKELVVSTGTASTTFLQRKLKIGYARAASIMDQLEARGVVSAQEGARPRKVNFQHQE